MSVEEILFDVEEHMEKTIAKLRSDLAGIRTGRANPGLVDSLRVEVYGSPTPLKQIAAVSCPEPQQILIRPYDPGTMGAIEKAIQAADLGMNPQNDGKLIRLNVPALSAEVRRKMVTRIKELAEESKVSLRNIRRDGNKKADSAEKGKTISEDQRDDAKKEIQDLIKKYEAKASNLAKDREKEVLEA